MNGKCKAITESGHKCEMLALTGEEYCQHHHPDPEKRVKPNYKISENNAIEFDYPIVTLKSIFELLGVCIQQTAALKFNYKILSAIQNACSTQAKIMETMIFAKKLRRLESMVKGDIRYEIYSQNDDIEEVA